ncbi:MAG: periplasmic heavy metal sensor [Verrucomicrobia bacterium]|nr:periplasmic heavy metal sensor [Verrucomicrobiota bacterium]
MKSLLPAIVLLIATLRVQAGPEAWLQAGLLKPEVIQQIKPGLQLTSEQEARMLAIVTAARTTGGPVEDALRARQQRLHDLLVRADTTAEAAGLQLAQVLESEAAIKQLQLRTLIALRDTLTPEQQKKIQTLGGPPAAAQQDRETALLAKANRLRAALEPYLTAALRERGAAIEQLIRTGDLKAADAALDRLIADSGANDGAAQSAPPDFSRYATGPTDIDTLTRRFDAAKEAAQRVIYLPLLRQLYVAKDAVETAKAAQDAAAVGRILTWAEQAMKK